MTAFRLALLHLIRKRLTTLIALIALAVSVAAGGVLIRLYLLSQSRFASVALQGDAVIGAKAGGLDILLGALNLEGPYPDFITSNLYETLRLHKGLGFGDKAQARPDYVKAIVPFLYFATYKGYRVIGTDSSFLSRPIPEETPVFAQGGFVSGPNEIVLGAEITRKEHLKIGDQITLKAWSPFDPNQTGGGVEVKVQVVGILASTGKIFDAAAFSSLAEAHQVLAESGYSHPVWGANILNY